jgi:hypothetical protein
MVETRDGRDSRWLSLSATVGVVVFDCVRRNGSRERGVGGLLAPKRWSVLIQSDRREFSPGSRPPT